MERILNHMHAIYRLQLIIFKLFLIYDQTFHALHIGNIYLAENINFLIFCG